MTGVPRIPSAVVYAQMGAALDSPIVYDPRPTTTNLRDRDEQIEKQREHLRDLNQWAKRLKGPCVECRWHSREYNRCHNPAVGRGTPDPITGDVDWRYPRCQEERDDEYPEQNHYGGATDERWRGKTLCGPEGLLFEPRTYKQFLRRWLLGGLWLAPIVALWLVVSYSK